MTHAGRMTDLSHTITDPPDTHTPVLPVLSQLELSHYNEKVRWALDYKRVPHVRRSLLPGPHRSIAKRLTDDMSTTTPVLTLDGRSIGDSTRIIAVIEQRWPQPSLYPDNDAHGNARSSSRSSSTSSSDHTSAARSTTRSCLTGAAAAPVHPRSAD